MPAGIIIILILTVLIAFGFGQRIQDGIALNKKSAVFFFLLLTFSYIVDPLYLEGVTAYYLPFITLLCYSVMLLFRLKHPMKSLLLSILSAFILYLFAQVISPQPIGLIYEPFFIYALITAVTSTVFSYGIRSVVFNSVFSFILFNAALIFTEEYNVILHHDVFGAICFSALIAYYPVSVLLKSSLFFKYRRSLQYEAEDKLIFKKRKW